MTHLEMLKEILEGQQERGIREGNWERTDYTKDKGIFHGSTEINIPSSKIVFVFNRNGRFVGMLNYKD